MSSANRPWGLAKPPETQSVTVLLPQEHIRVLRETAASSGRPLSAVVRETIARGLGLGESIDARLTDGYARGAVELSRQARYRRRKRAERASAAGASESEVQGALRGNRYLERIAGGVDFSDLDDTAVDAKGLTTAALAL